MEMNRNPKLEDSCVFYPQSGSRHRTFGFGSRISHFGFFAQFAAFFLCHAFARAYEVAIEIDLAAQKAWVLQDGQRVYETPISSGRAGYETPTGEYAVLEKDPDHRSSLYGRVVDGNGGVIIADADGDTPVPPGGKFVQAPMKNFMRFDGAVGMHAGRLPGYAASHGCVRLPAGKAALFYNIAEVGTPVRVFGHAPNGGPPRRLTRTPAATTPAPTAPAPFKWFPFITRKPSTPNSAQTAKASDASRSPAVQ
jgi:hypothetical protein